MTGDCVSELCLSARVTSVKQTISIRNNFQHQDEVIQREKNDFSDLNMMKVNDGLNSTNLCRSDVNKQG